MIQLKVCVIGGPSSGKTALALALAEKLKMQRFDVRMLNEYATEYIENVGVPTNVFEQFAIALGQEEIVVRALSGGKKSRDFLLCDSASFIPRVYAARYFLPDPSDLVAVEKFNYVLKKLGDWGRKRFFPSYHAIIFVPIEHGYYHDSIRFQGGEDEAHAIEDDILAYLKSEKVNVIKVSGTKEERLAAAVVHLVALKDNYK